MTKYGWKRGSQASGCCNAQRVYVGRDLAKSAIVNLGDRMGRTRLRLVVDSLGAARIEFLDESGRVSQRIPEGPR